MVTRLVGFSSTLKPKEVNAKQILKTLEDLVVRFYDISLTSCLFLVGDNCGVNKKMSKLSRIPLVGCASHRLNLEVEDFLKKVDTGGVLAKVSKIAFAINNSNRLRSELEEKTHLRAKGRNTTRWSSAYEMVERYLEIRDDLPSTVERLTVAEEAWLEKLFSGPMWFFQDATKRLQVEGINLLTARATFDSLLSVMEREEHFSGARLKNDDKIVVSKTFESAVTKLCSRNFEHSKLSEKEAKAMENFLLEKKPEEKGIKLTITEGLSDSDSDFVQTALPKGNLSNRMDPEELDREQTAVDIEEGLRDGETMDQGNN